MSALQIHLPDKIVDQLVAQPETGMGYQLVKVFLKSGQVLNKLKVLNSSILLIEGDRSINTSDIDRIELDV